VLYFKPQEVRQNDRENRLVLTNFSHFDQADQRVSTSTQDLNRLKNIVIPANNKYFQIDLALLSYVDSDLNKYTHYLEGLEDNWRPLQAQPSIQYNNLPQGRYTLHAKAISPTGKWSANEIVLGIIVKKAYYQQSWFYASLAALVASIFFLFYRNRAIQNLHLEKVRTALSRDLHDDVGGLLVGIALQMDIMQQQAPRTLKNQLSTIATTSRTAIRKMYDVLWAVDARNDHLGDLISHMQAYAIDFLEPLNIRFKFDTKDLNLDKRIAADVRQHLYLFYKECVHNAVKHSGTDEIHISIKYKKKKLHLEVRDFGQGLDVSKQSAYAGQGLQNLRARAKALKGKIQFLSDHGLSVLLSIEI
jgi:signal transduction histidine kinase